MSPRPIFIAQFLWFLVAWTTIAIVFVRPVLRRLPADRALAFCILPQLFRAMGLGLLVEQLSPGMPKAFATQTAIGDSITSVLALLTLVALQSGWPSARRLAWACTVVGAADLAIAFPHAALIGAAQYMHTQWYVPTVGVPLMIVAHTLAARNLLGLDREER